MNSGGIRFSSFNSTASGVLPGASPVRLPTRKICVSHGIHFAPTADFSLLEKGVAAARELSAPFHVGNVLSQDRLYDDEIDLEKLSAYGILAAEMETAALYLAAARHGVEALGLFTVSNHILTGAETSPEERETSFSDIAHVALETTVSD